MAYEQRDMSGSLFPNDKRTSENAPNLKGYVRINGVDYWVSAWTKTKQDGGKWLSLSVEAKEEQKAKPAPSKKTAPVDDDQDAIPF